MAGYYDIDPKKPHAFLSYTRADDECLNDGITWLKDNLEKTVRAFTGNEFRIFQDVDDIQIGENWPKKLDQALEAAQILIPILTPSFFASEFCRREAESFLDYEARANRDDLICPIYLIEADILDDPELRAGDRLATVLHARQRADWRDIRNALYDRGPRPRVEEVAKALANAAKYPAKVQARSASRRKIWQVIGGESWWRVKIGPDKPGGFRRDYIPPPVGPDHDTKGPAGRDIHRGEFPKDRAPESPAMDEPPKSSRPEGPKRSLEGQGGISGRESEPQPRRIAVPRRRWSIIIGACSLAVFLFAVLLWRFPNWTRTIEEQIADIKGAAESQSDNLPSTETKKPSEDIWPAVEERATTDLTIVPENENFDGSRKVDEEASAKGSSKSLFRDCQQCPELVVIPSGTFLMGSPKGEDGRYANEGPQRQVTIDRPFALGKYEVTRAEFRLFVSETGHEAAGCMLSDGKERVDDQDRDWRDPGYDQRENDPVVCVNWDDTKAYVGWLSEKAGQSYRLPSEAEWEYAARAGSSTAYFWGDAITTACDYANGHDRKTKKINGLRYDAFPCEDDHAETAPVGNFQPNSFGLYDMTGNVWEWVEDAWHADYDGAPVDGSTWTEVNTTGRVLRGGSWSYNPRNLRSANRREAEQGDRNTGDGFRVAKTLSP